MELTGKKVYSIEIRGVNAYKGSALSLMRGTEWSGQSEIEESGEGDKEEKGRKAGIICGCLLWTAP